MNRVFDITHWLVLLAFGTYCGHFILFEKHTVFETIVVAGLFLLVMRSETSE